MPGRHMSSSIDFDALGALYDQALIFEKAGETQKAASLYRQCLNLDKEDHCGASVRLASMGEDHPPSKAPDAYVKTLFDQHAENFDAILTGDLGYAVPMQLGEILKAGNHDFEVMLDLGCGTGLCAITLHELCNFMIGVDLSPQMITIADQRDYYDALYTNEIIYFLNEWHKARKAKQSAPKDQEEKDEGEYPEFDLIVAADIFPYLGELEDFFEAISKNISLGGMLAFSCETLPDQNFKEPYPDKGWTITPYQRFAHHEIYIKAFLKRYHFSKIHTFEAITVRTEEGAPIAGWLVIAQSDKERL